MSSTAIRRSIQTREQEIAACRQEIRSLEGKLENQTQIRSRFEESAQTYNHAIKEKRGRADAVISYAPMSTLADSFSVQINEHFSVGQSNEKLCRASEISVAMNAELRQTEDCLDDERRHLARLESGLLSLRASYRNAIANEESE